VTTIIDAMTDDECFGPPFEDDRWDARRVMFKAAFALPMTPRELVTFGELASGRSPPKKLVRELWVVAGRQPSRRERQHRPASLMSICRKTSHVTEVAMPHVSAAPRAQGLLGCALVAGA
jgi:hypothetical protein